MTRVWVCPSFSFSFCWLIKLVICVSGSSEMFMEAGCSIWSFSEWPFSQKFHQTFSYHWENFAVYLDTGCSSLPSLWVFGVVEFSSLFGVLFQHWRVCGLVNWNQNVILCRIPSIASCCKSSSVFPDAGMCVWSLSPFGSLIWLIRWVGLLHEADGIRHFLDVCSCTQRLG